MITLYRYTCNCTEPVPSWSSLYGAYPKLRYKFQHILHQKNVHYFKHFKVKQAFEDNWKVSCIFSSYLSPRANSKQQCNFPVKAYLYLPIKVYFFVIPWQVATHCVHSDTLQTVEKNVPSIFGFEISIGSSQITTKQVPATQLMKIFC